VKMRSELVSNRVLIHQMMVLRREEINLNDRVTKRKLNVIKVS